VMFNEHTWVKMTLSIEDVLDTLQRRASSGGKRALKECLRWKASPLELSKTTQVRVW
jgi:hypothetical protein